DVRPYGDRPGVRVRRLLRCRGLRRHQTRHAASLPGPRLARRTARRRLRVTPGSIPWPAPVHITRSRGSGRAAPAAHIARTRDARHPGRRQDLPSQGTSRTAAHRAGTRRPGRPGTADHDRKQILTMTLQGKTAIVTGGSRGIGRAIAERLGREGASVVVNYRSNLDAAELVVKTIKGAGGQAITAAADVATAEGVAGLFEAARLEFGGVDIVVNNAAIFLGGPVEYISEQDFDRLLGVNVKGVYFAAQQAAQHLRD